jgi:hypothetical protein
MKYRVLIIVILICNNVNAQRKIGVEASCLATNTTVDVPGLLKDHVQSASSGFGYFLSFGANLQLGKRLAIRVGPQFWKLAFSPEIKLGTGNDYLIAQETGSLNYSGIYLRVDCRWDYIFITGGFDISYDNSYSCNRVISNKSGVMIKEENGANKSMLTNNFSDQFNILVGMGPSIPIGTRVKLKGFLAAEAPLSSVYNSGLIVQTMYVPSGKSAGKEHVNVNYMPFFTYGVGVEYIFSKK